jgi:tetratricopeptide (TPR) repeat protein
MRRTAEAQSAYAAAAALVERELKVNSHDARNLAYLSVYLAKLGRHDMARQKSLEALRISSNDVGVIYRAGVVAALARRPDEALMFVRDAISRGYSKKSVSEDEDLVDLHSLAAFKSLVSEESVGQR